MEQAVNRVFLMGNMTRDVDLKNTQSGQAVAGFGVAVNRRWKDASGEQKEEVTFVDCEAWGKTAENIAKFFSKGKPIIVEGRLKLDQWEKEGQKFSKLRVVVENFHFIPGGKDDGAKTDAPRTTRRVPQPTDEPDIGF